MDTDSISLHLANRKWGEGSEITHGEFPVTGGPGFGGSQGNKQTATLLTPLLEEDWS